MSQIKHLYETTFIVNASLEDAQIETLLAHTGEIILRNGGEVKAINKWGRKRLAYTIQKKNNGFYVNLEFEAPGQVVTQLERAFVLDENILRFLTIQLDKKALKARQLPPPVPIEQEGEPTAKEQPSSVKAPLFDDEAEEPKV